MVSMRRAGGSAGSLVGVGIIAVAGTIAWHGVKNVGIVLQAQRELQKVSRSTCASVTCFPIRVGNAASREAPAVSREEFASDKHN